MNQLPTFTEYFDELVARMKKQIHKASDRDAFDAAVEHVRVHGIPPGCQPDSGWKAYDRRKWSAAKTRK